MAKSKRTTKSKLSAKRAYLAQKARAIGFLVVAAAFASLIGLFYFGGATLIKYRSAIESSELEPMRAEVISMVDRVGVPAPVEARTGNIHFPQADLYLPAPDSPTAFIYQMDDSVDDSRAVRVTTSFAIESGKMPLVRAKTKKQFYKSVPTLQACARGVLLTTESLDTGEELDFIDSLQLADGRSLSIYSEINCAALDSVVNQLRSLRSVQG